MLVYSMCEARDFIVVVPSLNWATKCTTLFIYLFIYLANHGQQNPTVQGNIRRDTDI